jgi:stage II sporulation protein E
MILQSCKKIAVLGAQKNISADGGISGDTVNLFFNKKDYFYALINDGMGSGREAALTSNLCSVFLEKMLRAGNRAETSIRMLNNMIRSRSADSVGECSSTVDLLEIDLMTANATFAKSGAAPSFILRGKTVHRLQAGTPPIGIISNLDMCGKQFELRDGDVIVMVSDGIEQNDPGCRWLVSYLASCADTSPEEIVYNICLHASGGENHDDCSAVSLRISEATEEE